jgi:hypothetical protein
MQCKRGDEGMKECMWGLKRPSRKRVRFGVRVRVGVRVGVGFGVRVRVGKPLGLGVVGWG